MAFDHAPLPERGSLWSWFGEHLKETGSRIERRLRERRKKRRGGRRQTDGSL